MNGEIRLSILVAFRGRELVRAERFLAALAGQSRTDFEVILLDYGSEPDLAGRVQRAVETHGFARYVYNDTRGMAWNRAHALNSAARLSRGDYLLCTDIDLVYSRDALRDLLAAASPERAIHGQLHLLPKGFAAWDELADGTRRDFPLSRPGTIGAVQLVPRDFFLRLRGFDEFFRIWGVEDYDLRRRLEKAGVERAGPMPELPPIYHQWHPKSATGPTPTGWIETMNLHAAMRANELVRNGEDWGRLLTAADRPALRVDSSTAVARRHTLPCWRSQPGRMFSPSQPDVAAWAKVTFIRDFVEGFATAKSGAIFVCDIASSPKIRLWELLSRTLLRHRCPPVGGRRFFRYRTEARDILWQVIVSTPLVADYAVEDRPDGTRTVLVRK